MSPSSKWPQSAHSSSSLALSFVDGSGDVDLSSPQGASFSKTSSASLAHPTEPRHRPHFHVPDTSGLKARLYEQVEPAHVKKFKRVLRDWQAERGAVFDMEHALALREQALKANGKLDSLRKQWASLPPSLPHFGKKDSNWANQLVRTIFHPKHLFIPGVDWATVPVTTVNRIKSEVDGILAQSGWKPVLGENIANSPRFQETYSRMPEAKVSLSKALTNASELHDEMHNDAIPRDPAAFNALYIAYHAAMETLAAQCNEAYLLCTDHEMAAGLIYKASVGNAGMLSHGVAQTITTGVAAVVAPFIGVPVVSLAFDLAADPMKKSDASRSDDITNRLNLLYAVISDNPQQLRGLWESPLQRQLPLLEEVLSYEMAGEKDEAKKAALQSDLERVRAADLESLSPDSRAAALLIDKEAFRSAAYSARISNQLARRIGVNAAGSFANSSVEAAGNITDDVFTTAAASGMETGVDVSTTVAQYTSDERANLQKNLVDEPDEETEQVEQSSGSVSPSMVHSKTWSSMSSDMSASISASVIGTASNIAGGMRDFGRFVVDETQNAGMGLWSASTYKELLATYQKATRFLKTAGGMSTPPDRGEWQWQSNMVMEVEQ